MRHKLRLSIQALVALSILTTTSCSAEAKFCDKMRSLYGEEMDDCETDALPEVKQQCTDPDAVFTCIAGASDKAAADKCWEEKC